MSFITSENNPAADFRASHVKWIRILCVSVFVLHFSYVKAQPCLIPILNNTIDIEAATCAGTVATLKGSVPIGGIGNYTYQWEKSVGNCLLGNFQPISGATARDYAVPSSADVNDCFRRVVNSGTCASSSNSTKVAAQDRTTPSVPVTTVVQSTCVTGTGAITVTSPLPGAGISYSIDGTTYTNTTGVFAGLLPGTYSVTAKYIAGCVSPVKTEIINSLPAVSGTISPSTATFCAGGSQVLTATGGTSYQWYRNGTIINGATASTYTATLAGTYTADIIVGFCKTLSTNSAVITVNPLPTGTISPGNVTICTGNSIALTANGGTSYQWYKDNIIINGATTATYTANQAGTYSVDVINSNNCKAKASNDAVVAIVAPPSGSISPASATICTGNSQVLTATGGSTYQWYKDGTIIAGATLSTYSATQAGTYSVVISNAGCSVPASNVATIMQVVSPSGVISPASVSLCPGRSAVLTANGASGGYTFQWFYNGAIINGATSSSYTASQTGSYSVVFSNGVCNASALNIVSVSPSAAITFTANTVNPGCTGASGSVVITGVTGGGSNSYSYSKDNGATFQASNTFAGLATGTYQVVVKDTSGCSSNPRPVVIQFIPSTLSATATKTDARCGLPNGSVSIQATGGSPAYTYSLNNGAYQASNTYANLAAGTHQVTVKDAGPCTFVVNFVIGQNGLPPNLIVTNPPVLCQGLTANLQAAAVTAGSDGALIYTYWRDTTTTLVLSNPGTVTAGTYFIRAINPAGCVTIKAVRVTSDNAALGKIINRDPVTACNGFPVTLTASAGTAYQWYRNDTLIAGATSASYTAIISGVYSVFINNGNCSVKASDTANLQFDDCDVKVFVPTGFTPDRNGTNDVLRPILYNVTSLRYFKIYNRWGRQVYQTNTPGQGWDGTINGVRQPSETYSWILEYATRSGEVFRQSGRSLLIR